MAAFLPSSPSCCPPGHTCAAGSPNFSHEGAASAGSSVRPAASPHAYSYLEQHQAKDGQRSIPWKETGTD